MATRETREATDARERKSLELAMGCLEEASIALHNMARQMRETADELHEKSEECRTRLRQLSPDLN